jgi:hypothetical protein
MILFAIDPGTRSLGVSIFKDRLLIAAKCITSPHQSGTGLRECADIARAAVDWLNTFDDDPDIIAFEVPQIYSRGEGKSKADPNKIMPLYGVDTAIVFAYPDANVSFGKPHAWKGGVQKPDTAGKPYPIEQRVRERLHPGEMDAFEKNWPKNVKHSYDITDSVGIGLFHLGRFERRRMFARE